MWAIDLMATSFRYYAATCFDSRLHMAQHYDHDETLTLETVGNSRMPNLRMATRDPSKEMHGVCGNLCIHPSMHPSIHAFMHPSVHLHVRMVDVFCDQLQPAAPPQAASTLHNPAVEALSCFMAPLTFGSL